MRARSAMALVVGAALVFAAPAGASVTFGANLNDGQPGHAAPSCPTTFFPSSPGETSSTGCIDVVVADNAGGPAAVPITGVLTSFSALSQEPITGHLRVLHDPGHNAQHFGFHEPMTYFATAPNVTLPGDNAIHTFPVRISVTAGDYIGFGNTSGNYIWRQSDTVHGGGRIYSDTADGTSPTEVLESESEAQSFQSPLSGVVEPDADNDGYGDDTQDQCATVPGPGPCPTNQPPAGGGPQGGTPPPDTTKPVLSSYVISPSSFVAANSGPSVVAAARVGATVVYKLSEPATVKFTAERKRPGIRKHGRCVAGKRGKGHKPCTRYLPVAGSFTNAGAAGLNSFRFMGRMGGRALARGNYRLVALAADGAGNRSARSRRPFRIVR